MLLPTLLMAALVQTRSLVVQGMTALLEELALTR
jgi:hypothetical protein